MLQDAVRYPMAPPPPGYSSTLACLIFHRECAPGYRIEPMKAGQRTKASSMLGIIGNSLFLWSRGARSTIFRMSAANRFSRVLRVEIALGFQNAGQVRS